MSNDLERSDQVRPGLSGEEAALRAAGRGDELRAILVYGRSYAEATESDELDLFLDTLEQGAHHA